MAKGGDPPLDQVIAQFAASLLVAYSTKALTQAEAEAQLTRPVATLLEDCGLVGGTVLVSEQAHVTGVGIPDLGVTVGGLLTGHVELKAPGRGANPARFTDAHDKRQWEHFSNLPNLLYTDGQSFGLYAYGEKVTDARLSGDPTQSGPSAVGPKDAGRLEPLLRSFLRWEPVVPPTPKQLAELSARLCRLLRNEVQLELESGAAAVTALKEDWGHLLFPEATAAQFADGYAQAITFGLLLARARNIDLADLGEVGKKIGAKHSLIGTALRVLGDSVVQDQALQTSVDLLLRVLGVVDWAKVSKGKSDAWLYFYEEFLATYDNELRKETGSYYTPPQVVTAMTRLAHEALVGHFDLPRGLAENIVTILDPAMGTGTYLLAVLRKIAETIDDDLGEGARAAALEGALSRLMGFELQLGPFAVAQLRIVAELTELGVATVPDDAVQMYVTNALDDPYVELEHLGAIYEPIAVSRREANRIKRDQPVMVVIGNPPYKARSPKGAGHWIERGNASAPAPLDAFRPPSDWGVGAHVKHLYNPYVYFWCLATWKVFDQEINGGKGLVAFITVAGFLNGPGFEKMRAYLRERADAIWIIGCSPEGHQPPVETRIFQAVQQPICITIAVRDGLTDSSEPATVHYRELAPGPRAHKFEELTAIELEQGGWQRCPSDWRAPFLPEGGSMWLSNPALEDLFAYGGSGTMPGRTWVVAPDPGTLRMRWDHLVKEKNETKKRELMQEHPRDRHIHKVLQDGLPGLPANLAPIVKENGTCPEPVQIGYRSFDRQWIIPDKRLINQPNPTLWQVRGPQQIYLAALTRTSPSSGPGATFSALVPDLHHYKGNFGGVAYPLWADSVAKTPNLPGGLIELLGDRLGSILSPLDFFAYVAAVVGTPAYTARFAGDLSQPGLRIPLTATPELFDRAAELGKRILWLYSFGQRCVDAGAGRPKHAPRIATAPPRVLSGHGIPSDALHMPDEMHYDADSETLHVGGGQISNVTPAMWNFEVSGMNVLRKWFSYRRKTRDRPVMGDRRVSPLMDEFVDHWLHSYTEELIDICHVLGLLTELTPVATALLDEICEGPLVTAADLQEGGVALSTTKVTNKRRKDDSHPSLLEPIQ